MHRKLFRGSFTHSGQVCIGMKRIYVHEKVYDAVRDALVEYAKTVKIGDPIDPSTEIGPMQNRMQYDKVLCVSLQLVWHCLPL